MFRLENNKLLKATKQKHLPCLENPHPRTSVSLSMCMCLQLGIALSLRMAFSQRLDTSQRSACLDYPWLRLQYVLIAPEKRGRDAQKLRGLGLLKHCEFVHAVDLSSKFVAEGDATDNRRLLRRSITVRDGAARRVQAAPRQMSCSFRQISHLPHFITNSTSARTLYPIT